MSKPACPGSRISKPGSRSRSVRHAATLCAAFLLWAAGLSTARAQQQAVDVTLVIAVDVSGSIDSREFELQRRGYISAITDKRFLGAIKGGDHQAIALAYFEWTGPGMNAPVYECAVIRNEADARAFAGQIQSTPRLLYGGGTGVGEAIYYGITMHDRCSAAPEIGRAHV